MKITNIKAFQIYDSRGLPTVACELTLDDKFKGLAKVPSGASTGSHEAIELRDDVSNQWFGKGVLKAVENINTTIKKELLGFPAFDQKALDEKMLALDGTSNKSKLGANAILATSLAYCVACANAKGVPLFKYIRKELLNNDSSKYCFPTPLVNVINGGQHSNNNIDFQEFMFVPVNQDSWFNTTKVAGECFLSLQKILTKKGFSTAKGDEGGFSIDLDSVEDALNLMVDAVSGAGYKLGKDVCFALDVAASEFYENGVYLVNRNGVKEKLTAEDMINWYGKLCQDYPIISIEDPLFEDDWEGFSKLTSLLNGKVQIVGDDLYCTNIELLKKGVSHKSSSAILIKLNQIGSLTECLQTIQYAQQNNLQTIISHRSGETEDDFIADLCLATNSHQIKTGSMSRSERLAKYNRLTYVDQTIVELESPKK